MDADAQNLFPSAVVNLLICLCQVESVGSGNCSSLHRGNHSRRDRPECFAAYQPHDHTHHEGAADCQR